MYATVCHELVQCQTAGLATYWVKGRYYDSLRSVVNHYFHAAGSLKGADVASFTAYDATLHLVVVYVED